MASIEFVQGNEQHSSYWGKFYVKGLEEWESREDDERNKKDNHHSYQCYVCLKVPAGTMFSVFLQDGDKYGTDTFEFYLCRVGGKNKQATIKHNYTECDVTGSFEVIAKGLTKTKAPRLMDWWNNSPQTLATAKRCAKYIDKRGQKTLPAR